LVALPFAQLLETSAGQKMTETEPMAAFAERVGVSRTTISEWVRRGLPCDERRRVKVEAAVLWVANLHRRPRPPKGFEVSSAFAERTGVTRQAVMRWIKNGIPQDENGYIDVAAGLVWLTNADKASVRRRADIRSLLLKEMKGASEEKLRAMLKAAIGHEVDSSKRSSLILKQRPNLRAKDEK
jgi:hypothetical protein